MMKKLNLFAFAGAIALLSLGFIACASDDDTVADVNPTYDPTTNTVTTQFVLNVSSAANTTRQSAATVQKNNNFRGMKDALLIGLKTDKASSFIAPLINALSVTVKQSYDLGTLYTNTQVENTGDKNEKESSNRIVELSLPTETDAMLVYGRAISEAGDAENGKVNMNIDKNSVLNTTISLVPRLDDSNAAKYGYVCELSAAILNRVVSSEISATPLPSSPTAHNGYTQQDELPALKWKDLGVVTNLSTLSPLEQILAKTYQELVSVYSNESVHSGSAKSVASIMKELYAIAETVDKATATGDAEYNAQLLAQRIKNVISYYFDTPAVSSSAPSYNFNNLGNPDTEGTPAYHLVNNTSYEATAFKSGGKFYDIDAYLQEFPTKFGLPDGLAQLEMTAFVRDADGKYQSGGEFKYKAADKNASLIDISSSSPLNLNKYTYPSELLYFDNSLLRVCDSDKESSQYPNGYNNWDTGGTSSLWSDWKVGAVKSTTRSVAVKNNINYGVAMLETNVELKEGVTSFADRRDDATVTFTAAEVKEFKLTGVLIGGQYKQLGWNYLADTEAESNDNYVIYDNAINGGGIPTNGEGNKPNYTLVFDNYAASSSENPQEEQQNVKVALEFENSDDKDIYGIGGGIIPKGCKFYLVGELKIKDTSTTPMSYNTLSDSSWPEYYAIPPYSAEGTSSKITRVFIQDYLTKATFTIGANSLKNAYTTVPDLRASQTSLGLSVDLNWRPGLNFNVDL